MVLKKWIKARKETYKRLIFFWIPQLGRTFMFIWITEFNKRTNLFYVGNRSRGPGTKKPAIQYDLLIFLYWILYVNWVMKNKENLRGWEKDNPCSFSFFFCKIHTPMCLVFWSINNKRHFIFKKPKTITLSPKISFIQEKIPMFSWPWLDSLVYGRECSPQ